MLVLVELPSADLCATTTVPADKNGFITSKDLFMNSTCWQLGISHVYNTAVHFKALVSLGLG